MFMGFTAANSLTDRFAWLFDGLCRAIGVDAQRQRMEAALAWAIWNRVRMLGDRLIALAERVRAGRVPRRRSTRSDTSPRLSPQGGDLRRAERPRAVNLFPREFGWARRMLPETGQYAGVLRYLLRDPETMALLEKAPQAGRMLRPLCHLLGVQTPEFLRRGAVVAQEAPATIAAEAPQAELEPRSPAPEPFGPSPQSDGVVGDPTAAGETAEAVPVAQSPPEPARLSAEEAAANYARRPGGLYWDGTRMRWS
jgi:hypothetical protein